MIKPYYTRAPKINAWLPTAFAVLDLSTVFRFAYYCTIFIYLTYWVWWAWILLASLIAVNIFLWLLLNDLSSSWLKKARLRSMRGACTPRQAAKGYDSEAEGRLARAFQDANIPVYHQQIVPRQFGFRYPYRTDLAFYDPSCGLRIDIEVDGEFKQNDYEEQQRMSTRDTWFISKGWHVLRFHAHDCYHASAACAAAVKQYTANATREHRSVLSQLKLEPSSEKAREKDALRI
jgi:very-short-patch-repair endonuclease